MEGLILESDRTNLSVDQDVSKYQGVKNFTLVARMQNSG